MDALKWRSTENAREFVENLPSPLREIAWELHDYAMLLWFDVKGAEDTIGFETVALTGFTTNQKKWLEKMKEQLENGYASGVKPDSS